jgi:CRP-like cAMP-binding protein
MVRPEITPQAFLAALPLFKALDAAALARLAAATTRRPLKRGEQLFSKGDAVTGMYVVVYGEIRLVARTPARGERLTGVVGAGRSFGEPVMFLGKPAVSIRWCCICPGRPSSTRSSVARCSHGGSSPA